MNAFCSIDPDTGGKMLKKVCIPASCSTPPGCGQPTQPLAYQPQPVPDNPTLEKMSLGEKEQLFLDALSAYYFDSGPKMSDEEFELLKDELVWSGSKVRAPHRRCRRARATRAGTCALPGRPRVSLFARPAGLGRGSPPDLAASTHPPRPATAQVAVLSPDEQRLLEARAAYARGSPIMSDADYDALRLRLRRTGSEVTAQGPRCSLRSRKLYSDCSVDYLRMVGARGARGLDGIAGWLATRALPGCR